MTSGLSTGNAISNFVLACKLYYTSTRKGEPLHYRWRGVLAEQLDNQSRSTATQKYQLHSTSWPANSYQQEQLVTSLATQLPGCMYASGYDRIGMQTFQQKTNRRSARPASLSKNVKVANLAKNTREEDLKARLKRFHISSVILIECPYPARFNYAYVNCQDHATAQQVVDEVHQKMLLHSNLLTAKIKGYTRGGHFSSPESHIDNQLSQLSSDNKTVKVTIYSSRTTGTVLDNYFEKFGRLSSQTIIRQGSPCYAYVNFEHYLSALRVCNASPHIIDGSQVKAIPYNATRRTPPTMDITAIKILFDADEMTGTDLDDYFERYGELSSQTIIRQGSSHFAYVNFMDPSSAQEARIASPHTINGISVTTVLYRATSGAPPTNPVKELVSMDFLCDPLAVKFVEKELTQYFKGQPMMKINTKSNKFIIHIKAIMADSAKKKIQSTIEAHESKIGTDEVELEFYYLPVLADQATRKEILNIEVPFLLTVSCGREQVPLQKLSEDYSKNSDNSLDNPSLKNYLTSSTGKETKYEWRWFDGVTYQPYSEEVNKRIEKEFKHKGTFKQEICKFEYIIDTLRMRQINTTTNRERKLKRSTMCSSESSIITLRLRACKDHMQELKREIVERINSSIQEKKITLPDITSKLSPFVDHLLATAKKKYVRANLEEGSVSTIVLRGKNILVNGTEMELYKEIQKKEREMEVISQLSKPSHWEPQIDRCELKSLVRRSSEWNKVKNRMLNPDFKVEIIKIERIQNTWLWETYHQSTKRMSSKNDGLVNEKMLFHGTRQTQPKDIYDSEQGFDSRLSSQGLWGEGTYFAVKVEYSNKYAHTLVTGNKQIFLAQVLTGISCKYTTKDQSLRAPPKKSDIPPSGTLNNHKFKGERYDSVSAETNGSEIYVIYEIGRVYPAYLITYTT